MKNDHNKQNYCRSEQQFERQLEKRGRIPYDAEEEAKYGNHKNINQTQHNYDQSIN